MDKFCSPFFVCLSLHISRGGLRRAGLLRAAAPGCGSWGGLGGRRDIFLSDHDLNDFSLLCYLNLGLWCAVLLRVVLYSVWGVLWGPGGPGGLQLGPGPCVLLLHLCILVLVLFGRVVAAQFLPYWLYSRQYSRLLPIF